jgi:nucleoside-diphosphate-sugar epimerase
MTAIRLFVFGLGYSAGAFARRMKAEGVPVAGTVRTPEKAARLRAEGIEAFVFDGTAPGEGVAAALAASTDLLVSVAPGTATGQASETAADPVLAHHRGDILAAPALRWIGYLSTVGVYGDYAGAWVSEKTTPHPSPGRSAARLAAEKEWTALARERGLPLAILRIAGIYGPGRNALANLAEGTARRIVKDGQVFNRIHVDDIVAVLQAALARSAAGIYNLTDDEPAPPQDVIAFAAGLMGVPVPPAIPFDEAALSDMARSFYADNKRVKNDRIRRDLAVALRHPTYREGLAALWSGGTWRG